MILVRRAGRWSVIGDLRSDGVRPRQCCGEVDAGSGDFGASGVRMSERHLKGEGAAAESPDGRDDRRLGVRSCVNRDGLTRAEANRVGDRDDGRTRGGGGDGRGCTGRAHRGDNRGLAGSARIDRDLLSGLETFHALHLDIGRAFSRGDGQGSGGLGEEVVAVAIGVGAIGKTARAGIGSRGCNAAPEVHRRARCRRMTATLLGSGSCLVALGSPRVDQAAVIEAVDDQAGGIAQHHAALSEGNGAFKERNVRGELGAAKPLVGFRRALVAGRLDGGIMHHCVDRVLLCERTVERDTGAQRLDRLVARVGKGGRRLEGDSRSSIAEGQVFCMVEFERGAQLQTGPRNDHSLGVSMRFLEGGGKVDAGASGTGVCRWR